MKEWIEFQIQQSDGAWKSLAKNISMEDGQDFKRLFHDRVTQIVQVTTVETREVIG